MKMKKVKGFTLIELIVVMAIFGVILAGAMSLMQPVSKVMVQSETYEGGNAAVTSITNYLEKTLASVEFLECYGNPSTTDPAALASEFVERTYEGLVKDNSSVTNVHYADGLVHVMVIDNSDIDELGEGNTHIQEYTYQFNDFSNPSNCTEVNHVTDAINAAYYNTYDFQVKVGIYDDEEDPGWLSPITDASAFGANLRADHMAFTVRAVTHPRGNGKVYSFMHNQQFATTINDVSGFYYELGEEVVTEPGGEDATESDGSYVTEPGFSPITPDLTSNPTHYFNAMGDAFDNYYFVYSYGAEINTRG